MRSPGKKNQNVKRSRLPAVILGSTSGNVCPKGSIPHPKLAPCIRVIPRSRSALVHSCTSCTLELRVMGADLYPRNAVPPSNRNIVACYGIGKYEDDHPHHPGSLFIVQELVQGGNMLHKVGGAGWLAGRDWNKALVTLFPRSCLTAVDGGRHAPACGVSWEMKHNLVQDFPAATQAEFAVPARSSRSPHTSGTGGPA